MESHTESQNDLGGRGPQGPSSSKPPAMGKGANH